MISHKHQCIFIHIPKCAGTSIEDVLGHFDQHKGRKGQDHRSIRMIQKPAISHHTVANLDNLKDFARRIRQNYRKVANPNNALRVDAKQYQQYYKFTFVRNPWFRAYSWYQNAMRDPIHQRNYGIEPSLNFNQFIKKHIGKGFLRPQTYWLKDYKGNIAMDFVGKFENLRQDFAQVCESLSIEPIELPHKISGNNHDPRKAFDNDTIELIGEHYREEIQLFGYQFE